MSDFSGLEQSFALPAMTSLADEAPPSGPRTHSGLHPRSFDVRLGEVRFRRVHAESELAAVQRLRAEIQLPGAAKADPGFRAREKKEIGTVWSVHSNGVAISSAR